MHFLFYAGTLTNKPVFFLIDIDWKRTFAKEGVANRTHVGGGCGNGFS